jgi:hypothetical protein
MKRCPSCGYDNPDSGTKCVICSRDVSGVTPWRPAAPQKESGLMIAAGLALIGCGIAFFLADRFGPRSAPAPAASEDRAYSYDGTYYSLDKMASLRFLPRADKFKAVKLISCPDPRVARAAAKLAAQWAAEEEDPADGQYFFGTLVAAALSGGSACAEAAVQAGLLIARGFQCRPYLADIRRAAAGLAASADPDTRAAGFMLSSMAGMQDLKAEMQKTLRYDPSSDAKLYAACALARLGEADGYAHITGLASGGDPDTRNEALACLAYSSVPGTDAFLASAARGADRDTAAMAKSVLMSRKQLAIISR